MAHGTATVTDFLKDFSHDEVAFLLLDRHQGEFRFMKYPELNHVLNDMMPHIKNPTTGGASAPTPKKIIARDIVTRGGGHLSAHTTADPLAGPQDDVIRRPPP
jgi:hypothetical protein